MTYCVGLCLKDGLVFLSDTRTNAGVDQIGTFRKMALFQKDGDRFFAMMSAGNLAVTQAVKEILLQGQLFHGKNLWNVENSHDAAVVIGEAVKQVYDRDHKALEKAGWKIGDLDLVEANEAFAAQAIAVNKDLGWDTEKVNVNGGAIAIGHPIGASGARVFVTLLHEMQKRNAKKGLATLCIGGGMGIALTVER